MKTYFKIKNGCKFAEQDEFEHGCMPDTGFHVGIDVELHGNTVKELLNQIKLFLDVDDDCLMLDSCDDKGRVDVSRMENERGDMANINEIATWKTGHTKLWNAIYTFSVVRVVEEEVQLTGPQWE